MFLLPITAWSMARGKAGGPPGPAMLGLPTCGVKTTDREAESETVAMCCGWVAWLGALVEGWGWGGGVLIHLVAL